MYCNNCHKDYENGENYCPKCGKKINENYKSSKKEIDSLGVIAFFAGAVIAYAIAEKIDFYDFFFMSIASPLLAAVVAMFGAVPVAIANEMMESNAVKHFASTKKLRGALFFILVIVFAFVEYKFFINI